MSTNDTLKTFNDMTTKGLERASSLGELNLSVFERLANRQMDALGLYLDHSMRLMTLATESKGYNEFFKGQVEATKTLTERMMDESKATMQVLGETRDEYRAWLEKNMAEISADVRKGVSAN
ncbi:phasin family protein [Marichromatium bheemlicum]|uniref:Phasin family protein n=1 Tax=Marichromatium bheemlicum TaxID=365339 RepID=A0ABX1IA74_9GAMM|nr:phasin family protein [Marichromatium bheemlicum]NKN33904.1 phasin family protein [Marichromatium bheemlicum]